VLLAAGVVYLFFLHPVSGGLFAVFSAAAFARGSWRLAIGLMCVATARFLVINAGYESRELTGPILLQHFHASVGSLVLWTVLCSWVAGAALILMSAARWRPGVRRGLEAFTLAAVASMFYALVRWAADVHAWSDAHDFRAIAPFAVAPLYALAILDHRSPAWAGPAVQPRLSRACRTWIVAAGGIAFATVLCVQSVKWVGLTGALLSELRRMPAGCVSAGMLAGATRQTALRHWAMPFTAILEQGRAPRWVVVVDGGCGDAASQLPLAPWFSRPVSSGWFDLTAARTLPAGPATCTASLGEGWYGPEAIGDDRWRWTGERGAVEIRATDAAGSLAITGAVLTLPLPNTVRVLADGSIIADIRLTGFRTSFGPLALPPGRTRHRLTFVSLQPPVVQPHDPRALGIAVVNLRVLDAGMVACTPY
jgi:hypothetical protein